MIGLWAKILKQVPNSNILLKFKSGQDDEIREIFLKQFEDEGISRDRIAISGWLQTPADLALYNRVDIVLDTFPYNGTTTTCQALLMGVPVISLVGQHHMSRVGLSILTNLGFEFFAAPTPEQYVARASALALKSDSLAKIRNTMRDRMRASTLCNKVIFAARMENAYRQMWHNWCQKQIDKNLTSSEKSVLSTPT
jgi:predicted O-linked N-acetylglucosamine transferase (SPINDLY family)